MVRVKFTKLDKPRQPMRWRDSVGCGNGLWKDEHPDDYVRRLRED